MITRNTFNSSIKSLAINIVKKAMATEISGGIVPVMLVHGGAGNISIDRVPAKLSGVKLSASLGYEVLQKGGSALDAVEAAVRSMESDAAFNAGYGSVVNMAGEVEMDASIMDGATLASGCLGAVKDIAHPISLARLVMTKTKHVLLVGEGAKQFAIEQGVPLLPPGNLVTNAAMEALEKYKIKGGVADTEYGAQTKKGDVVGDVGTVGAVAVDKNGHVAVATSTGGMIGKLVGRVGDTAIIGSGSYADDNIGAVSTTGHGDTIMKVCLAYGILRSMENGNTAQEATKTSIEKMTKRLTHTAGAITVSNKGDIGVYFSSNRMAWAYQKGNEMHYGIDKDQHEKDLCK